MSRHYFSYDEEEAYKEGRRDEQSHRHNWEYDNWSSDSKDKAYFEGREDEKRAERIREEERQMEEEQMRRDEERAYYRRMEEEQQQWEMEQQYDLIQEYNEEKQMQQANWDDFVEQEYLSQIDLIIEDIKDVMLAIMEA